MTATHTAWFIIADVYAIREGDKLSGKLIGIYDGETAMLTTEGNNFDYYCPTLEDAMDLVADR